MDRWTDRGDWKVSFVIVQLASSLFLMIETFPADSRRRNSPFFVRYFFLLSLSSFFRHFDISQTA